MEFTDIRESKQEK